jgi:hypothetical protein
LAAIEIRNTQDDLERWFEAYVKLMLPAVMTVETLHPIEHVVLGRTPAIPE